MESSNNNNVVSLAEFRRRKEDPELKKSRWLDEFVESYHEAGPEAMDMFNNAMVMFRAHGFETDDFEHRDILLLREVLFSIILRYRGTHHPLHTFADEFDKYFNKLEYHLDTEWDELSNSDSDNEGPKPV